MYMYCAHVAILGGCLQGSNGANSFFFKFFFFLNSLLGLTIANISVTSPIVINMPTRLVKQRIPLFNALNI